MSVQEVENAKLDQSLLDTVVAVKVARSSLVDLERRFICLEMERSLSIKINEEFLYCLSCTSTSDGQSIRKLMKNIPPIWL